MPTIRAAVFYPAVLSGSLLLGLYKPDLARAEEPRYDHAQHEEAGVKMTCGACHGGAADGTLAWPGQDHKPCSNGLCHAGEFKKRESSFCLSCHTSRSVAPPNPLRSSFSGGDPFDGRFSHAQHLALPILAKRSGCASCHPGPAGEERVVTADVLAPQHGLCASCHEALSSPVMTECAECHVASGSELARVLPKNGGKWVVTAKFEHDGHRRDVRTAKVADAAKKGWERYDASSAEPLECRSCHGDVLETDGIPPRPGKKDCTACHDGNYAFKTSGFGCAKCHGPKEPS